MFAVLATHLPALATSTPETHPAGTIAAKIVQALSVGPPNITKDTTVADMDRTAP
jgi:hypothetical protein